MTTLDRRQYKFEQKHLVGQHYFAPPYPYGRMDDLCVVCEDTAEMSIHMVGGMDQVKEAR